MRNQELEKGSKQKDRNKLVKTKDRQNECKHLVPVATSKSPRERNTVPTCF